MTEHSNHHSGNECSYAPLRGTLLTRDELASLSKLRGWPVVKETVLAWVSIVAAWYLVSLHTAWWTVLIAGVVVGVKYYALYIVAHDGLHRRLFASRTANDLWTDALLLGPIGAICRLNRHNHMTHHRRLATASDPDRFKYTYSHRSTGILFAFGLTGLPFVLRAVTNVLFPGGTQKASALAPAPKSTYLIRDLMILLGWQLILASVLTLMISWWAYFLLWWIPVYVFTFATDITRVFCEHSRLMGDPEKDGDMRLASFHTSWFERQIFAPCNMNHHAAHHLWPSIPFYHLADADQIAVSRSAGAIQVRKSYFAYMLVALRDL